MRLCTICASKGSLEKGNGLHLSVPHDRMIGGISPISKGATRTFMRGKTEESIADAYMRWKDAKNKDQYPPGIARIFQRLEEFFDALRTRVKEITGKDLSWDEIFQKVDTGEIGGREGDAPLKEGAF